MNEIAFSIRSKFLILNTLLIILTSLVISIILLSESRDILIEKETQGLKDSVNVFKNSFFSKISILKEDVLMLSKTPPISGIIRTRQNNGIDPIDGSTEAQWNFRLTQIFSEFLRAKTYYLSARYIGISEEGKEIVRVDKKGNTILIIPKEKLQKKGHRKYFKGPLTLVNEQVYLSDITLNKEHNKLSIPHVPVIRAATPIIDKYGNIFGIIVINLKATSLFKNGTPLQFPYYITNSEGAFLYHPNPDKTFGFDVGENWNIQHEIQESNIFFDPKKPVQKKIIFSNSSNSPSIIYFSKLRYDSINKENFLGVAISANKESIFSAIDRTLYKLSFYILITVLIALAITYLFIRHFTKPIHQLIVGAENISQGLSPGIFFPTKTNDELGYLAKTLENMGNEINERTSKLKTSERTVRSIMNNVPNGIITFDSKGKICTINPAVERLFYTEATKLLGHSILELIAEPDNRWFEHNINRFMQSGESEIMGVSHEIYGLRKDGKTFPLELSVGTMHFRQDEDSAEKLYIGVLTNVGERKQNEQKLTVLYAHNKAILDNTGEGIYGVDLEGKATFINNSAVTMLGFNAEELIGQNMHMLTHHTRANGAPYPIEECVIYKSFHNNQPCHSSGDYFWRKDRSGFPVEFISKPILENNQVVGAVISFNDITERKRKEALLIDAKIQAEQASVAKTEFLSKMSHELRTPLNAIIGFSQLMQTDDLSDEQHENNNEINKAGLHLLELINDILDLTSIESGKLEVKVERLQLNIAINACLSLIQPLAKNKQIIIIDNITKENDFYLLADPVRLKQIIINFLSNAIKYIPEYGSVSLQSETSDSDKLRIIVADSGPGLTESQISKVFQPFERLDAGNAVDGTGIGLAISKKIANLMNGEVGVNSKINEGCSFWVELPLLKR